MKLKLITLVYNQEEGGFPADPLADVEGEVLSVVEHFFHVAGLPHLLLLVHHNDQAPSGRVPRRLGDGGLRATLAAHEQPLFDLLRAWRNGRAETDGVPPYILLSNRQLIDIVRRRPTTLTELREVSGIGEAKAARFGRDLLAVLARGGGGPAPAHGTTPPAPSVTRP